MTTNTLLMIKKLIHQQPLGENESYDLFQEFINTAIIQQAAILALLTSKGLTVTELSGALRYFLEQGTTISYSHEVIDIVGTGGDGLNTFNISTAASIVAASAGALVAKHGGRAASSQSGSMDVMEKLNIPLYQTAAQIVTSLDRYRYAYLSGPYFNPLLKNLAPLRKSLGFRTILNILAPLANPLRPKAMLLGVYSKDLLRKLAEVLLMAGKRHVMIVCSEEGLDEFSVSGPTHVAELMPDSSIREYSITPEAVGLASAPLSEVMGGTPSQNADLIEDIFTGKIKGAKRDIVLLNAAGGLVVAGKVNDLREGVCVASEAIQSGQAYALLTHIKGGV